VREAVLKKEKTIPWLSGLAKEWVLIAPSKRGGDVLFKEVDSVEEVCLDYTNSTTSVKEFFFPQWEPIIHYSDRGKNWEFAGRGDERRLFFGIRPCDVHGLLLLDKVFSEGTEDPYWTRRRRSTLIVSLACNGPCTETCFCSSMGTGPFPIRGFDIVLIDLGDRFFVEAGTVEGERILDGKDAFFEDASEADRLGKWRMQKTAHQAFKRSIEISDIPFRLEKLAEDPLWQSVSQKCLRCSGCVYVCPTCHCFNVVERSNGGERIRCWDGCMLGGFTRMAGGFNPRPTQRERLRHWYYHKFRYFVLEYGDVGCVGCGRCTETCIGNIDVLRTLEEVRKR